jgi:hypothetical protein
MKRIAKAIYMTPSELETLILERTVEAYKLPPDSEARSQIMKEIAQLRMYADAKRWIESPGLKPGLRDRASSRGSYTP